MPESEKRVRNEGSRGVKSPLKAGRGSESSLSSGVSSQNGKHCLGPSHLSARTACRKEGITVVDRVQKGRPRAHGGAHYQLYAQGCASLCARIINDRMAGRMTNLARMTLPIGDLPRFLLALSDHPSYLSGRAE